MEDRDTKDSVQGQTQPPEIQESPARTTQAASKEKSKGKSRGRKINDSEVFELGLVSSPANKIMSE